MKLKKRKYGELKYEVRFALFITEVMSESGELEKIWFEKYYDVYKWTEVSDGDYFSHDRSISKERYKWECG